MWYAIFENGNPISITSQEPTGLRDGLTYISTPDDPRGQSWDGAKFVPIVRPKTRTQLAREAWTAATTTNAKIDALALALGVTD